ncbi:MAG: hypothetical protein ACXACI_03295 [Candidatus Hodarchaeales archaeon]|jgi:hypothetical protein
MMDSKEVELNTNKLLKGAEVSFTCLCGEKVSIPFSFKQPLAKTFTIPCLCQMHYTIDIEREQEALTVHVIGKRDKLETIF